MKRKLLIFMSILLCASMLLASCAPKAETEITPSKQISDKKEINIGVVGPFTGPNSKAGQEIHDVNQMVFDEAGGMIGDYKVNLVWINDQSDPQKAVTAFKDAILSKDIQAGLSGYHSSVTMALMDATYQYKIPYLFPLNESSAIVEKFKSDPVKYQDFQWKGRPSPSRNITGYREAIFKNAIEKGIWKPINNKFGVICEDTDLGRDMCATFKGIGQGEGWSLIGEEYVSSSTTEFYPILSKFKNQKPSLVFSNMGTPASEAALLKQAKEINLDTLFVAHGLAWIGEWYSLTGDASDYVLDMEVKWSTPKQLEFRKKFHDKFGYDVSTASAIVYDYGNFFLKICKRAIEVYGVLDSESIFKIANDEVSTGKLTYTDGILYKELKWTPETLPEMLVGPDYYFDTIVQYFNGEPTIIYPDSVKEADLKVK
jgi:branched-chain amino acid transport system substrate-binding protein